MNKEAYAKLPADQREVLTKAIVELSPKMTKLLFEEEAGRRPSARPKA